MNQSRPQSSALQDRLISVQDWNGELNQAKSQPFSEQNQPTHAHAASLVTVNDYQLPDEIMEEIIGSGYPYQRQHQAIRDFGYLVPINYLNCHTGTRSASEPAEEERKEQEYEEDYSNKQPTHSSINKRQAHHAHSSPSSNTRGSIDFTKQQPHHGSSHQRHGRPPSSSAKKSRTSKLDLPYSLYHASMEAAKEELNQQPHILNFPSSEASPIAHSSSTHQLHFNHLHGNRPDPVALLKNIEVRQIRSSVVAMEQDLLQLENKAMELSAEYQADSRTLKQYQLRMKQRKEALLASRLTHTQQLWLEQEKRTRQAQTTLNEIDAIMNMKPINPDRPQQPSQPSQSSETVANNRPSKASESLPPPFAASLTAAPAVSSRSTNVRPLSGAVAVSSHVNSSPPFSSPTTDSSTSIPSSSAAAASRGPSVTSQIRSAAADATRLLKKKHPIGGKMKSKPLIPRQKSVSPVRRLESDLDSALSAAQSLMLNFMGKIK